MTEQGRFPAIDVFATDAPLVLEMAPNGGWIVSQVSGRGIEPKKLGAYSSAQDMLDALSDALAAARSEAKP